MPSAVEVEQLLALGHESRSFEVKGPGSLTDTGYCARVARAVMAMGNLRDGGLVCLGVQDTSLEAMLPGLDPEQLAQWSDFDNVADAIARFAAPPVGFTVHRLTLSSGARVVVLDVAEFEDVPHVCGRDFPGILQRGALYVRPRGKPRSEHVPTSEEMRELLELATDKRVRAFVGRLTAIGIPLGPPDGAAGPTDAEPFAAEAAHAWANPSDVLRSITALGHFDVAIRPEPYQGDRVAQQDLETLMAEHTVRLRGWPLPYTSPHAPLLRTKGWIGQDSAPERVPHREAWRLCRSGQFLHRRALVTDLRESQQTAPDVPGASGAVAVWDVLLYLVEAAELGARLSLALGGVPVSFTVALRAVAGRQLVSGDWNRELHGNYLAGGDTLEYEQRFEAAELAGDARTVGVGLAQGLLRLFGLNLPDQVLHEWQAQVFSAR